MQNFVGSEVFNKRTGARGTVTGQDSLTIIVETAGLSKTLTWANFQRWFTIIPEDKPESDAAVGTSEESKPVSKPKEMLRVPNPSGEPGMGLELRVKFLEIIKVYAAEKADICILYNDVTHTDTVKYKGRNVFECTYASRRLNVLCHPDSLTPANLQRANQVHPKEWGWSLRAKFVFTDLSQVPLMKTIITDGLYYREHTGD